MTDPREFNRLADRLADYRIWNHAHHRYDAVPIIQDAANALRTAAAESGAGAVKVSLLDGSFFVQMECGVIAFHQPPTI